MYQLPTAISSETIGQRYIVDLLKNGHELTNGAALAPLQPFVEAEKAEADAVVQEVTPSIQKVGNWVNV